MASLLNKNILVTGSRKGIGRSIVEKCAQEGANVWAHARSFDQEFEDMCSMYSSKYCVKIMPIYFDMLDIAELKKTVSSLRKSDFKINGLVNNAGITYNSLFQMTSEVQLRENLEINFIAPFLLTQIVTKLMVKNGGGSIVNISSTAAFDSNEGRSAYGASKAALSCSSIVLARELGGQNIRSNVIAPGMTDTDMLSSMSQEVIDQTANSACLKRFGHPSEIASAVSFLISDASSYITGQVLRVDGGM